MLNYENPIIPGFYPDPSICRVGEDYYIVTALLNFSPVYLCGTAVICSIGSRKATF